MILFLDEDDVSSVVSMDDALVAVRHAFISQAEGSGANLARDRVAVDGAHLALQGAVLAMGTRWIGTKINASSSGMKRSWSLLFDEAGALRCVAHAERLGQLRTAAATAISAEVLARPDAEVLTIIGTGFHAYTQVEAIVRLRPHLRVLVCGRTPENVGAFVARARRDLGVDAVARPDVDAAVAESDIVVTATRGSEAILHGSCLRLGSHVALVGSNNPKNREADGDVFRRAGAVYTDDLAQAKLEGGDLLAGVREGALSWDRVQLLANAVVARGAHGAVPRDRETITVFSSHGVGLWDTAIAVAAFEQALERGAGTFVPINGSAESDDRRRRSADWISR